MGFRRKQYCLLFKERIPARDKARLPGKPQHCHQDEEKRGHHFRVAVKESRKSRFKNRELSFLTWLLEAAIPTANTDDRKHRCYLSTRLAGSELGNKLTGMLEAAEANVGGRERAQRCCE